MEATPSKFIAYYRVSTRRQGLSGLGLEAQESTVKAYVANKQGDLLAAYTEVESGRKTKRPQLAAALRHCKATGATLIVAKLDRLARNTLFLLQVMQSGAEILACDCPRMNKLTLTVFAAVAEYEADRIRERIKEALAEAKKRGVKLGGFRPEMQVHRDEWEARRKENSAAAHREKADEHALNVGAHIRQAQNAGQTLRQIVQTLNDKNIQTANGGKWYATTVKNVIARLDALGA